MIDKLKNNSGFWRKLTNLWAVVVYIAIIYDFINNNAAAEILGPLLAIYVAVLAFYAGDKEFDRWHYNHKEKHPGEVFVMVWTILIITITAIDFIFSLPYQMPSEVVSTYIAVLGILAITGKSKFYYKRKKGNNL